MAERAHVSPMSVSRTLRNDPAVSAKTRTRVLDAVAALGYQTNEAARSLRLGGSSGVIGLIVTNLGNPFYSQLALGVEAAANELGMRVLLGNSGEDPGREQQLVHDFASRRVSGLIVVPCSNDHSHLSPARLDGLSVVLAASPPARIDVDSVLLDDFTGAWEAVRLLVSRGHQRIAFLGPFASTWTGSERFRGFCAGLEEASLPIDDNYVLLHNADVATAERSTCTLLDAPNPPTAIFAANSRNTIGAYRAIRRRGATVALAGFDDFELAGTLAIPLAVVAYDPRQMGVEATRLLGERIKNLGNTQVMTARRVLIPARIIEYDVDILAR